MKEKVFVVQSVKLCYGELLDKKVEGVFDSLDKAKKLRKNWKMITNPILKSFME